VLLTVTNRGPADAANVFVTDRKSPFTSIGSVESTRGSCATANGEIRCEIGRLAAGENAIVTARATLGSQLTTIRHTLTAEAVSDSGPRVEARTQHEFTEGARADLEVQFEDPRWRAYTTASPQRPVKVEVVNVGNIASQPGTLLINTTSLQRIPGLPRVSLPSIDPGGRFSFSFDMPDVHQPTEVQVWAESRSANDVNPSNDRGGMWIRYVAPFAGQLENDEARITDVYGKLSNRGSAIVPGSDPAIFGVNLAGQTIAAAGPGLPFELGGAYAHLDDMPVPLVQAGPDRIEFQVPWELEGKSSALLTVVVRGKALDPIRVRLAGYAPEIFPSEMSGGQQGMVTIGETKLLAAPEGSAPESRPARRDETLTIHCIGLGPVTERQRSGKPAPADRLLRTTVVPKVTLGGVEAKVISSGLTPGATGRYQVQIEIPAEAPAGDAVPLQISVGLSSSSVVTVALAQ
jgi:uncharacterized protein (TIGR03437 family)